jgi:hypothetical protein
MKLEEIPVLTALSRRDLFVLSVANGLLSSPHYDYSCPYNDLISNAIPIADALIKEIDSAEEQKQ